MLGRAFSTAHLCYGFDFNAGNTDTFSLIRMMDFMFCDASICDTTGQLLFYTNGITVQNRNHADMLNTTGFNPGLATNAWAAHGLQIQQACLILPVPESGSIYYVFHESGENIPATMTLPVNLSYSEIDMSLDGGLGGITARKNVHIIEDTLMFGRVAACKHANGVDYWVMAHEFFTNTFYKTLVTADTMLVDTQSIGMVNSNVTLLNYYGQAIFNSAGTKYAVEINDTTVELYDFDRCSGMLSNPIAISKLDTTQGGGVLALVGSAFSASGQYLYLNSSIRIYQYDAYAPNVLATEQLVAQWDTFTSPCCGSYTTFFMMQLAPDNRIYVSQSVGQDILHYIEFPDSAGMACNVVQNSFITPGRNTFTFPNIVNYDLMNDTTSLCDTVLSVGSWHPEGSVGKKEITIFPNPTRGSFWVNYSLSVNEKAILEIYDALGNRVQQNILYGHSKSLLVHSDKLNEGIYFYKVVFREKNFASGKIVIMK